MQEIVNILREIRPEEDYEVSNNFIVDGLLDSFDLVVLVSELDNHFSISIEGTDILPENFENIDSISALIRKYTE
ncbi:acyl carrier protein [Carboxylicivirga marina]|uniref:acyl carrier protein n=1 Tax=Carboxylicivirga marina TaxID=2800988 RepID=UPI002591F0B2|nr:acyl carrier protein [uncultured Carboxylicivirga sp.]